MAVARAPPPLALPARRLPVDLSLPTTPAPRHRRAFHNSSAATVLIAIFACVQAVKLCLTPDEAHLFLGGADGSLVMYEVRDRDGRLPLSDMNVKGVLSLSCTTYP